MGSLGPEVRSTARLQAIAARAVALSLIVIAATSSAHAQTRLRRPYGPGHALGHGFDHDGGAGGCVDYACGGACYDGHTGSDFSLPFGTEVLAAQGGRVVARYDGCANDGYVGNPCGGRCGNHVQLRHADSSLTIYCHMQAGSLRVDVGDSVACAQPIGRSGSSGSSSGPHLHLGWRPGGGASRDPFEGACGAPSSAWVQQRDHGAAPGTECSGCAPQAEVCDGRDQDCDGRVDESLTRGCGSEVGECAPGLERCGAGAWGSCRGSEGPTEERCDSRDNDCDGAADEGDVCVRDQTSPGVGGDLDEAPLTESVATEATGADEAPGCEAAWRLARGSRIAGRGPPPVALVAALLVWVRSRAGRRRRSAEAKSAA